MKAVWHAIAQCYVKEPLLYLFSVSDVKKGSVVSIKLKCDDELVLYSPKLHYTSSCHNSKSHRFHKTLWLNMNFKILFARPVFVVGKK